MVADLRGLNHMSSHRRVPACKFFCNRAYKPVSSIVLHRLNHLYLLSAAFGLFLVGELILRVVDAWLFQRGQNSEMVQLDG